MNGLTFYTSGTGAIYVPLPREVWRSCGECHCPECQGREGFWDTLVVPGANDGQPYTFTVHFPKLRTECPDWLTRGHRRAARRTA